MAQGRPWRLFGGVGPGNPRRHPSDEVSADFAVTTNESAGGALSSEPDAAFADFPEAVLVIDPVGRLAVANEAAVDLARLAGIPLELDQDVSPLLAKLRPANGGGAPPWSPVEIDDWEGRLADLAASQPGEAIFDLKVAFRRDLVGRPIDIVVRLIDVTSFAEALRGRRAAEQHRDRFLKLLSHDMRSPLAAILATLKHPDLSALPPTPRAIIESASNQALAMVDATVRLTRAECADYRFAELDFCHVVEEAVDACWAKAKSARVKIVLDPCEDSFPVLADRGYLTEALVALLGRMVDLSIGSRVLTCSLGTRAPEGRASVTLRVQGLRDDRLEAQPNAATELTKLYEQDGQLQLFKTVVTRHKGAASIEVDAGSFALTTTLPLVETTRSGP